jgi:hypothetical protein
MESFETSHFISMAKYAVTVAETGPSPNRLHSAFAVLVRFWRVHQRGPPAAPSAEAHPEGRNSASAPRTCTMVCTQRTLLRRRPEKRR